MPLMLRNVSFMSVEQIKEWLTNLEMQFELIPDINTFMIEWDVEGKMFEVRVTVRADKWIHVAVLLLKPEELPSDQKEEIYGFLLRENWMHDDVTYSMDENDNLYSENDIPECTNMDNFASELNAVVFGLEHFYTNVSTKFGIEPKGK